MKTILIAGAKSYIGCSFEEYIKKSRGEYMIDTVDMMGDAWKDIDLSKYQCLFFVAGIVHRKNDVDPQLYYAVNRDLPVEMAKKAKESGVEKFIYLSSMSVYGDSEGIINNNTEILPKSHYGISKYQAEQQLFPLSGDGFEVFALRPPMVYGNGCKGNYNTLAKFVKKLGVFPDFTNQRSMIYIDNLSCFVKRIVDGELPGGVWLPQNKEYVNTSDMVRIIAAANNKKIWMPKIFNPFIRLFKKMNIQPAVKCFGNYCYSKDDPRNLINEVDFNTSVMKTEGK